MLQFLMEHNIHNVVKPGAERDGESAISFPLLPASVFDKFEMRMEEWHFIPALLLLGVVSRSLALSEIGRKVFAKITPPLQLAEGNQKNTRVM